MTNTLDKKILTLPLSIKIVDCNGNGNFDFNGNNKYDFNGNNSYDTNGNN